ncbi:WD40 repeat domain-containing protein [Nostoc sp. UIC 10890]
MEIYVQSAGVSQEHDYSWQKITDNGQTPTNEPSQIKKFKYLLENESPSLLLARDAGKLILLVTGMKASQRKDYRGRTIRNTVAWICQDAEENEQKLRGIAALSLQGELDNKIDNAVINAGEYGFEVSYNELRNLKVPITQNSYPTEHWMLAENSNSNREKLAKVLLSESLPKTEHDTEVLVVVTGIKAENTLKEARVWRGLSTLVQNKGFMRYPLPNIYKKSPESAQTNQGNNIRIVLILLASIGLLALVSLFFFRPFLLSQRFTPKPQTSVALAVISQGGQYIVSNNTNGNLLVKNLTDTTTISLDSEAKTAVKISSLAISFDGKTIIGGDTDGQVWLWKKEDNKFNGKPFNKKHQAEVLSVAISENGEQIISSSADGTVLLWDKQGNYQTIKK